MIWTLSLSTQTDPDSTRMVRRLVRSIVNYEGGSEHEARALELALGEALANTTAHAYPGAVGPVSIAATFDRGTFTFTVLDRGETASTPTVPQALPDARKSLGLFLISSLVDYLEIKQNGNGTGRGVSITMIKRLREA